MVGQFSLEGDILFKPNTEMIPPAPHLIPEVENMVIHPLQGQFLWSSKWTNARKV